MFQLQQTDDSPVVPNRLFATVLWWFSAFGLDIGREGGYLPSCDPLLFAIFSLPSLPQWPCGRCTSKWRHREEQLVVLRRRLYFHVLFLPLPELPVKEGQSDLSLWTSQSTVGVTQCLPPPETWLCWLRHPHCSSFYQCAQFILISNMYFIGKAWFVLCI